MVICLILARKEMRTKVDKDMSLEKRSFYTVHPSRGAIFFSSALFDPLLHFYKRLHWPAAGDPPG